MSTVEMIAFASSLAQIGPLMRDVEGSALVLEAIAGHHPIDSTSVAMTVPSCRSAHSADLSGPR